MTSVSHRRQDAVDDNEETHLIPGLPVRVASSGYVERDGHVIWEVSKVAVLQSHDFAGEAIRKNTASGSSGETMFIYLAEDKVLRLGEQEARWDAARSPGVRLSFTSITRAVTNHAPRQALQAEAPRTTAEARERRARRGVESDRPEPQLVGQKPRRPDASFVGRDGAQPAGRRAKNYDVLDAQRR